MKATPKNRDDGTSAMTPSNHCEPTYGPKIRTTIGRQKDSHSDLGIRTFCCQREPFEPIWKEMRRYLHTYIEIYTTQITHTHIYIGT